MSLFDHPIVSDRYFFPRASYPKGFTDVEVSGAKLRCFANQVDADAPTVIFFHGNGEVVDDYVPDWVSLFESLGANVFFAEYRGYGGSTGIPQLATMLDDVDAIFAAAGAPAKRTIAFGRSIGSLYAIELARRSKCAGLILESGIHSVLERILLRASPAELGTTMAALEQEDARCFDHGAKLAEYSGDLLILHALHDSLVDIEHARANFEASKLPSKSGIGEQPEKHLVEFARGDHNSVFWDNKDAYIAELRTFLQKFA